MRKKIRRRPAVERCTLKRQPEVLEILLEITGVSFRGPPLNRSGFPIGRHRHTLIRMGHSPRSTEKFHGGSIGFQQSSGLFP